MNKEKGEAITAAEMATLTRLEAPNSRVRDLTGIEYAIELTVLNLGAVFINGNHINSNDISDISHLSGLSQADGVVPPSQYDMGYFPAVGLNGAGKTGC